ncbi:hypothetical protein [Metamycoplasma neophronis]|uniref:Uncharacterized protein n=1 Tax=Metamycoplasma neophronis TaxID=872983 RepID=A0ABY2Z4K6_9BACT|nr:hypothetical protein [Metamycoplasma neophronis]TPR53390.1 hypothetical protein FJR74_02660 [Metamycoplasma neophronis]
MSALISCDVKVNKNEVTSAYCACHNLVFDPNIKNEANNLSTSQLKTIADLFNFKLKAEYENIDPQTLIDIFKHKIENEDYLQHQKIIEDNEFKKYFDLQIPKLQSNKHLIEYKFLINEKNQIVLKYRIICLDRMINNHHYVEDVGIIILETNF